MNEASQIVEALGGTVAVANRLDLTPSTVSSWKASGRIPRWWMPGIKTFAREAGVDLAIVATSKLDARSGDVESVAHREGR